MTSDRPPPLTFPVVTIHDAGPALPPNWAPVMAAHAAMVDRPVSVPRPDLLDAGGVYNYRALDGVGVATWFPELEDWYHAACPLVEMIVGETVMTSPYEGSTITAKQYPPDVGRQGCHRDTNPISVVTFLTTGGAPTHIDPGNDRPLILVPPVARAVLVFPGQILDHWVPSSPVARACAVFNYYTPAGFWRPDGIDEIVYGPA